MKAINIIEQEQLRKALCDFKQMLALCTDLTFDEAMEIKAIKKQANECLSIIGMQSVSNDEAYKLFVEAEDEPLGTIQHKYWPASGDGWNALVGLIESKYADALLTMAKI